MSETAIDVAEVDTGECPSQLRDLLGEFHEWLAETAPTDYDPEAGLAGDVRALGAEPRSWAWVATLDGEPAGCVLLYGVTDDLAEFRRLWVRPRHRRNGVGRRLTEVVIDRACSRGYATLGLTTPPWSEAAQALYESLGFERTAPYPETRLDERYHDDAIFMRLDLTGAAQSSGSR